MKQGDALAVATISSWPRHRGSPRATPALLQPWATSRSCVGCQGLRHPVGSSFQLLLPTCLHKCLSLAGRRNLCIAAAVPDEPCSLPCTATPVPHDGSRAGMALGLPPPPTCISQEHGGRKCLPPSSSDRRGVQLHHLYPLDLPLQRTKLAQPALKVDCCLSCWCHTPDCWHSLHHRIATGITWCTRSRLQAMGCQPLF